MQFSKLPCSQNGKVEDFVFPNQKVRDPTQGVAKCVAITNFVISSCLDDTSIDAKGFDHIKENIKVKGESQ